MCALLSLALLFTACSRKDSCEVVQVRPLFEYHKVRTNETLGSIAQIYHMSVQEICRLNGLSPNALLIPGQKVFVLPYSKEGSQDTSSKKPVISVETTPHFFLETEEAADSKEDILEPSDEALEKSDRLNSLKNEDEGGRLPPQKHSEVYAWPVKGKLLRRFQEKLPNNNISEGINISAPAGTRVQACEDGTVMDTGELVLGFGKIIILLHDSGFISIYGHLQEINVARPKQGEKVFVKKGQNIGRVGKTGNVRTPQLHFQLRNANKTPVNPLQYLEKDPQLTN
ncbi:hypothetical protein AGMMS49949_09610 [Alphaproteobacteria bacterium]|nr:hypothetical protein AGMMS49949_09610 [Alphaproteobacteria bacterium]